MSSKLRRFLLDAYESRRSAHLPLKIHNDFPIQIDDQDDTDNILEFCNIFCTVDSRGKFRIDLVGNFPITEEMSDLVDIYDGIADRDSGRLSISLKPEQIEVLMDLADKIRKTAFLGPQVHNASWLKLSARTISSLYRFVRIIKEFRHSHH